MTMTARNRGGVTILEPRGKITIGAGDIAMREAVDEALAAGSTKILIDFSKVTRMDSSGMAELVAAFKRISDAGGQIKLLHLPSNIRDVLGITQIARVFDVYEDEDEAVQAFPV